MAFELVKADTDVAIARGDESSVVAALALTDRIVKEAVGSETIRKAGVLAVKLRRWQEKRAKEGPGSAREDLASATLEKLRERQLISKEEYESKRAGLIIEI